MTALTLSGFIDRPEEVIGGAEPLRAVSAQALHEWDLVQRAQRLDPSALSWLFQVYYPKVYNYARLQLGDIQLAEDVASDVMVKLLESLKGFRFRGAPFAAWVFRIARNRVIDVQRRRHRRGQVELNPAMAADQQNLLTTVERSLDRSQLQMALRRLTEKQRQVIILKFIEGFDNPSVARALGRSQGAVKSLQHRALASLKRILSEGKG